MWDKIIVKHSKWFTANEHNLYKALNYSFDEPYIIKRKGENLRLKNIEKFTLSKMTDKLGKILDRYMKDIPVMSELKLPKLKKVDKQTNKIKLPKLRKV